MEEIDGDKTLMNVPVKRKFFSLLLLSLSFLFMLCGTMVLIWLGRDRNMILGTKLIALDLQPLLGDSQKVKKETFEGKVIVLHFWGTWCPPCREEYPEFAKLAEKYASSSDVKILSVSCEGSETTREELKENTENFLKANKLEMPIYIDGAVFTRANIAKLLPQGGFVYPTTIVVDSEGTIQHVYRGMANMRQVEMNILNLLKKQPQSQQ